MDGVNRKTALNKRLKIDFYEKRLRGSNGHLCGKLKVMIKYLDKCCESTGQKLIDSNFQKIDSIFF
ncbi:hypothetical protein BpHYR1_049895 [Brachionus plicatilis]|uniref:Uncharacterized protein n=1 Tax=Brachionus plicatilis TaxID=10195 RepID=A0A3M7QGA5_BRAPC|nr:hypothetical protein BpHYR1_049895 [Brachionus plicatilis]